MVKKVGAFWLLLLLTLSACGTFRPFREGQASFDMGLALFNQGKFQESIRYFERATIEDPEFAEAYFYLGRAQISMRRWRDAIQPLRAAYRLAPAETRQEVFNLLMDALFAVAADTLPPDRSGPPPEPRDR